MEKLTKDILSELDSLTDKEKESLLDELRKKVDEIDTEIIKLLAERAKHSRMIGRIKSALNLPDFSSEREKKILANLFDNLPKDLPKAHLIRIYERILDESRVIQREGRKHEG